MIQLFLFLIAFSAHVGPAYAQAENQSADARIGRLEKRVGALESTTPDVNGISSENADEITKLRLELQLPEPLGPGFTALGPAASRVYTSRNPFSVGGFAEVIYSAPDRSAKTVSLARTDLFVGSRLAANLIFNSAIEFANGGAMDGTGAARVNYAYVDYLFNREPKVLSGLRVGNILIPFGITNLQFEPTMYPMVNRPRIEQTIIPGTWHENGLLGFWTSERWLTQIGIVNAGYMGELGPLGTSALDERTWIRGGRQGGANALASTAAFVARFESAPAADRPGFPRPALGLSVYGGSWAQGNRAAYGDANVFLAEGHAGIRLGQTQLQIMHVEGSLSDTDKIYATTGHALGQRVTGTTAIASLDVLPVRPKTDNDSSQIRELPIFVSYEREDMQAELHGGVPSQPGMKVTTVTVGANFRPHEQFIVKVDVASENPENAASQRILESSIGVTF